MGFCRAVGQVAPQALPDNLLEGSQDGPGMLLLFHLDTFDVCDGWDTDPIKAVRDGNRLYGLGIHDMKAGGACILGALEAIVQ